VEPAAVFDLTFEVPGEPRGKGRPRATVRGGYAHVYTDAKTRSEEGAIRWIANAAMNAEPPYEKAVVLEVWAFRLIPTAFSRMKREAAESGNLAPISKPDADNYLKMVDALNGIVWRDDSQVVTAIVHKRYSVRPRLVIRVRSV
jgi:Holliday junction resolvase RusA-like endonuclease